MGNQEIFERIIQKLTEKTGSMHPCPICGQTAWQVGNLYVVQALSPRPTELKIGGPVYPMIPLICSHCGNTHQMNLLVLGFGEEELKSMGLTSDAGE
jgi:hypothetical protein